MLLGNPVASALSINPCATPENIWALIFCGQAFVAR